jgi:hypothetical protein
MAEPQRLEIQVANESTSRDGAEELALENARRFVDSLLRSPLEPIQGSNGMHVMRDVFNLETSCTINIILRTISKRFWQSCLEEVDAPNRRCRVCAVGTPGTGKSSSIPLLIRMLLQGHSTATVVYVLRKPSDDPVWYYEFKRAKNIVTVSVYDKKRDIASLRERSTYYIIDPGKTKDTCGPADDFLPKTILICSPDDRHWGGSEFSKHRDNVMGVFKYYPIWTPDELICARATLVPDMSQGDVEDRYRKFGGVPRMVLKMTLNNEGQLLLEQDLAVQRLTSDQAMNIAYGKVSKVETFDSSQPKSALIGIMSGSDDEFRSYDVEVISPLVAEKICASFISTLWNTMLSSEDSHSWKIFEAYTRQLMTLGSNDLFQGRWCVGKKHPKYNVVERLTLGGCHDIRQTTDVVGSAVSMPDIVFHPIDPQHKLIDFMYQDKFRVLHAFQVTLGKKHSAKQTHIKTLQDAVGETRQLRLYYLVPDKNYSVFVTVPGEPIPLATMSQNNSFITIYHVMVPNPGEEHSALP